MENKIPTAEELCKKYKKHLVEGVHGYSNISGDGMFIGDIFEVMVDFAKLMCKEQRKICAKYVDKDSILNSPAPDIK